MTDTGHKFSLPVDLMVAHINVALLIYQTNKMSAYD